MAKAHTTLQGEGTSCTQSRHEREISWWKSEMFHGTSLRKQRGSPKQPCQKHTKVSCPTAGLKSVNILLISCYFLLIYHPKLLGLGTISSLSAHSLIPCPLAQRSPRSQGDFRISAFQRGREGEQEHLISALCHGGHFTSQRHSWLGSATSWLLSLSRGRPGEHEERRRDHGDGRREVGHRCWSRHREFLRSWE